MKNAVITGATRGIGRAVALAMADNGFNVAFAARTPNDVEGLKLELQNRCPGGQHMGVVADLASKSEAKFFAQTILKEYSGIDLLVNNAGTYLPGLMLEEEDANFEYQLNLNTYSAYYLTKTLAPAMAAQKKGHIFFICSALSTQPRKGAGAYAVSKAAMKSLADNFREELREHFVKVTSILPFATYTSSWEGTSIAPEKFIQPEDIANTILSAYNTSRNAVVEEIFINNLQAL